MVFGLFWFFWFLNHFGFFRLFLKNNFAMLLKNFILGTPPSIFFRSFSECADTKQILERQVLRARFLGLILNYTSSQSRESNPGQLGEKRERYLCAILSPHYNRYGLFLSNICLLFSLTPLLSFKERLDWLSIISRKATTLLLRTEMCPLRIPTRQYLLVGMDVFETKVLIKVTAGNCSITLTGLLVL